MGIGRPLFRETVAALAQPRRLLPILLVCVPLVVAQGSLSRDPLAVPLGILTCVAFVLVAPISWRVLLPDEAERGQFVIRALLYAGVGAGVVLVLGVVIPRFLGMGQTFLTHRSSLAVSGALFLVGGWGLARDIGFEASLASERARAAALAREAEQAQLLALRAHLDPHFLFNTLNAIAEWCRQDGEIAERAVLQLSSILRTLLEGVRAASWPLERELELLRTLFLLHELRHGSAFSVRWEVAPEAGAAPVPPMILLPLAENAVKHGPAAGHRGTITVAARPEGGLVRVRLENPGPYAGPRAGSAGLPMVERRLALAYGNAARLSIAGDGQRTAVELELPAGGPLPGVVV
jgi:signal transduction histidine kinase